MRRPLPPAMILSTAVAVLAQACAGWHKATTQCSFMCILRRTMGTQHDPAIENSSLTGIKLDSGKAGSGPCCRQRNRGACRSRGLGAGQSSFGNSGTKTRYGQDRAVLKAQRGFPLSDYPLPQLPDSDLVYGPP